MRTCPVRVNFCPRVYSCPRANMDQILVTPAPMVQKYCKKVKSLSFKDLGVYSTNPLKLTKKSPLMDASIIEDIEQLDTNVFQVDMSDEDGYTKTFMLVVPLEED